MMKYRPRFRDTHIHPYTATEAQLASNLRSVDGLVFLRSRRNCKRLFEKQVGENVELQAARSMCRSQAQHLTIPKSQSGYPKNYFGRVVHQERKGYSRERLAFACSAMRGGAEWFCNIQIGTLRLCYLMRSPAVAITPKGRRHSKGLRVAGPVVNFTG